MSAMLSPIRFFISCLTVWSAFAVPTDKNSLSLKAYENCQSCHQQAFSHWQQSDHSQAMALANKNTIQGKFDGSAIEHHGQEAKFYTKNGQYKVEISDSNNHYRTGMACVLIVTLMGSKETTLRVTRHLAPPI